MSVLSEAVPSRADLAEAIDRWRDLGLVGLALLSRRRTLSDLLGRSPAAAYRRGAVVVQASKAGGFRASWRDDHDGVDVVDLDREGYDGP